MFQCRHVIEAISTSQSSRNLDILYVTICIIYSVQVYPRCLTKKASMRSLPSIWLVTSFYAWTYTRIISGHMFGGLKKVLKSCIFTEIGIVFILCFPFSRNILYIFYLVKHVLVHVVHKIWILQPNYDASVCKYSEWRVKIFEYFH